MIRRRRCKLIPSSQAEMKLALSLLHIFIAAVYAGRQPIHRVPCGIGAAACSCSETATSCEFDLQISVLQTFTRYPVNGTSIHDLYGSLHYVDENGQIVSYDGSSYNNGFTEAATVDGKTYRSFIAVNGRSPGPTLIVTENQRVIVNVKNNVRGQVITIHWHGQLLQDTPWMDGVPFISQCPLTSGGVFRYIFKAQPSGTFWYHSHVEGQRGDGLLGALIVRERTAEPTYDYLRDLPDCHTLVLQDWWPQPFLDVFTVMHSAGGIFPQAVGELPAIGSSYSTSILPDGSEHGSIPFYSALINGKGKHRDVPFRKSRLATFKVDYTKSYRFRVIGGQMLFGFKLSIDQHKLTVISSDGFLIQPIYNVDYLIVYPGERYDFVLTANKNPSNYYWIRVETLEVNATDPKGPPYPSLGNSVQAVLYYSSSREPSSSDYLTIQSTPPSCTKSSPCVAVNCPFKAFHKFYHTKCVNVGDYKLLNPTSAKSLPSNKPSPGQEHFLNFGYSGSNGELRIPDNINGRSFMMLPEPLQLQSLFGSLNLSGLTCPAQPNSCLDGCMCLHMLSIPYDKTVRLVLVNFGTESHSIHLHGHSFFVTAVGYGGYNGTIGFVSTTNAALSCQLDEMDENSFSTKRPCTSLHWRMGRSPAVSLGPHTVRKDTVIVPSGAYVIIQFVSSSPGYWFLHCHMDLHHMEGMALVLNVAETLQKRAPLGMTSCGDFKLPIYENRRLRNGR